MTKFWPKISSKISDQLLKISWNTTANHLPVNNFSVTPSQAAILVLAYQHIKIAIPPAAYTDLRGVRMPHKFPKHCLPPSPVCPSFRLCYLSAESVYYNVKTKIRKVPVSWKQKMTKTLLGCRISVYLLVACNTPRNTFFRYTTACCTADLIAAVLRCSIKANNWWLRAAFTFTATDVL